MKVTIGNYTHMVDKRHETIAIIKSDFRERLQKGDSVVWTKTNRHVEICNQASIVDSRGNVKMTALIHGGSIMPKVAKTTKTKKATPEIETTPPIKVTKTKSGKAAISLNKEVKVVKKNTTKSQHQVIAESFMKLPKSGKTIEEIAKTVHKVCGGNIASIKTIIEREARFVGHMGLLIKKGKKLSKI